MNDTTGPVCRPAADVRTDSLELEGAVGCIHVRFRPCGAWHVTDRWEPLWAGEHGEYACRGPSAILARPLTELTGDPVADQNLPLLGTEDLPLLKA